MRWRAQVLVIVSLVLLSQAAVACPVCFAPKNEENRTAFILMTGFLTALPLALIGTGVWWYRRRVLVHKRRATRENRAQRRKQSALLQQGSTVRQAYFGADYASTPRGH
jgi:hypothetical protein